MGNLFVSQILWAKEGSRAANRELKHAKKMVDRSGTLLDSWYDRWFGHTQRPLVRYRLNRKTLMR